MPQGKPAGERCVQLDVQNHCRLFGQSERPAVCGSFAASADTCGNSSEEAMQTLAELEAATANLEP